MARPARHVVELHEALRHHQRMVVRQAGDARTELDVLGAVGGDADDDLGRGDDLPARRVVLADPRLVVAEGVEPLDQFQVAVERQGGVVADAVERGEEDAEAQAVVGHGGTFSLRDGACGWRGREGGSARRIRRTTEAHGGFLVRFPMDFACGSRSARFLPRHPPACPGDPDQHRAARDPPDKPGDDGGVQPADDEESPAISAAAGRTPGFRSRARRAAPWPRSARPWPCRSSAGC